MVHDASTGFHDIKPLPEFYPVNMLIWGLIALLVLLAVYVLYVRRKRKQHVAVSIPPLPADQLALNEIERLEQLRKVNNINLRDLASSLSICLRFFLEAVLHFPATDQTSREVLTSLNNDLKKKLPLVPKDQLSVFCSQLEEMLRVVDFFSFATNSDKLYSLDDPRLIHSIEQGKTNIKRLSYWLKKEAERLQSVMEVSRIDAA